MRFDLLVMSVAQGTARQPRYLYTFHQSTANVNEVLVRLTGSATPSFSFERYGMREHAVKYHWKLMSRCF